MKQKRGAGTRAAVALLKKLEAIADETEAIIETAKNERLLRRLEKLADETIALLDGAKPKGAKKNGK